MRFVNHTPHEIVVLHNGEEVLRLPKPPEGTLIPRVKTTRVISAVLTPDETGRPVHVWKTEYGAAENLPFPEPHVYRVVSLMVKQACPERHDLVSPGELVRDKDGKPIGCDGLAR